MSDLISRQDVLGYIDRLDTTGLGKGKALEYIRKYVECSQSVDLVRCGECKYWTEELEFCQISEVFPIVTRADSYCSYGERRNDE